MVEAFDLIEFFAVASLFGWLSFSGLNESRISRVKHKNDEARKNLRSISEYFIISFIFYAISACCDYFFHHSTLLGVILPNYGFAVATILTFMAGTMALSLPVIEIRRVGWEKLGDISIPPIDYTLGFSLPIIASATLAFSIFTSSWIARAILVSSVVFPLVGFYLAWKHYPLAGRKRIMVVILESIPWLALAILLLIEISWWRIS